MVESEAKELAEDVMLGAVMFGHKGFQPVIDAIIKLAEVAAKEPRDFTAPTFGDLEGDARRHRGELRAAYKITDKQDATPVDAAKAKVKAHFAPAEGEKRSIRRQVATVFKELQAKIVRWNILDTEPHRRPRPRRPCARSSPKSACCRAPTVRRCSPAARRRRWSSPRSAPARTSSTSTR
jgi:polyribonucleotide nucleotidyltransferase